MRMKLKVKYLRKLKNILAELLHITKLAELPNLKVQTSIVKSEKCKGKFKVIFLSLQLIGCNFTGKQPFLIQRR